MLAAITNDTCVKSSISSKAYKVVSPHAHEMSGWKKLSRLIHSRSPHIEGINGDAKSDLFILVLKNG